MSEICDSNEIVFIKKLYEYMYMMYLISNHFYELKCILKIS